MKYIPSIAFEEMSGSGALSENELKSWVNANL